MRICASHVKTTCQLLVRRKLLSIIKWPIHLTLSIILRNNFQNFFPQKWVEETSWKCNFIFWKLESKNTEREHFKTIFILLREMIIALKWRKLLKTVTCSVTQVQKRANHVHGFAIQVSHWLVQITQNAHVTVHSGVAGMVMFNLRHQFVLRNIGLKHFQWIEN